MRLTGFLRNSRYHDHFWNIGKREYPYLQQPMEEWKNGKQYGLIKYYPRRPDHEDPPIVPAMLFRVVRIKPYKGNPYWQKDILDFYCLGQNRKQNSAITIVKNTPEDCERLWKIKHIIRVNPIILPEGWSIDDPHLENSYLHEDGRFEIVKNIDSKRAEEFVKFKNNPKRFDRQTVKERYLDSWNIAGFAPMTGNQ